MNCSSFQSFASFPQFPEILENVDPFFIHAVNVIKLERNISMSLHGRTLKMENNGMR